MCHLITLILIHYPMMTIWLIVINHSLIESFDCDRDNVSDDVCDANESDVWTNMHDELKQLNS